MEGGFDTQERWLLLQSMSMVVMVPYFQTGRRQKTQQCIDNLKNFTGCPAIYGGSGKIVFWAWDWGIKKQKSKKKISKLANTKRFMVGTSLFSFYCCSRRKKGLLLPMSMSHFIPSLKCHIFPSINPPWMVFRWSPLFISNLYCW